jgi:hypothetical protein
MVLTPLAEKILSGAIMDGASVQLRKMPNNSDLTFLVTPPEEPQAEVPTNHSLVAKKIEALADSDSQ